MENKIVNIALENLKLNTGIDGQYKARTKTELDGELRLNLNAEWLLFTVEVKREVRNHQLNNLILNSKKYNAYLIVAENIFPKIKEALRGLNIAYLDTAGNIFFKTPQQYLWVENGIHKKITRIKTSRAFTTTGLKVIFHLLNDESILNLPQRKIAQIAGVALGNINYVLNGLKDQQFIIQKNKSEMQLINKKELLEKWIAGYEERLKPSLHLANFRFLKNEDYDIWQKIVLKKNHSFWGGEPAGALLTKYLLPQNFEIYSDENINSIVKNYRMIPDPTGNISVYKNFTNFNFDGKENVVNLLLVYADLINKGDRRCMETAQKIYDELLRNKFQ